MFIHAQFFGVFTTNLQQNHGILIPSLVPKWTGKLWVAQMTCSYQLWCAAVLPPQLSWYAIYAHFYPGVDLHPTAFFFLPLSRFARSSAKLCISRKISCRSMKHRPIKERWFFHSAISEGHTVLSLLLLTWRFPMMRLFPLGWTIIHDWPCPGLYSDLL